MNYAFFGAIEAAQYPICVLTPNINKLAIQNAYITPFGANVDEWLVLTLHRSQTQKKTPMAEMKSYIQSELVPVFEDMAVEYLVVTDAEYFKALTGVAKVEVHLGYVMDCLFGPWRVVYVPHHSRILYDPDKIKPKIALGIEALIQHRSGNYQAPGASIIKFAAYPSSPKEIEDWLEMLIAADRPLTCDIEGFSLKHHTAGIGTITFCWDEHEGIAFPVDLGPDGATVRALLKSFFLRFTQKLIYHSIGYDVYVLIYQLFMDDILDTEGLLEGLEVMLRNWDCTKLIAYLATNSCAGNDLKLKSLAQEFAGNWAVEEIKDITKIPLSQLLQYNLVDGLSTWYVWKKYHPIMLNDQQSQVYEGLFKDAMVDIIQMQLTGMPLNMTRVHEVADVLEAYQTESTAIIHGSPLVQKFTDVLQAAHVAKRNAELKKKQITMTDPETLAVVFNPNSGPQLQELLYSFLGLPVIARTDSKAPSTGGKVLKALKNHPMVQKQPLIDQLLDALIGYKAVAKMLTDFIPAMKAAAQGPDGWHYLFGNFNLGGTISGRLSSSGPNLQNLPANVYMLITAAFLARFPILAPYVKKGELSLGKLIKSCFEAPPGWLFGGLDFASLEDKISALTTQDPNKLKVYTDGYDGHSLRAYAYWPDLMPDIRQSLGKRVFKVSQDGTDHYLLEGDKVQLSDGSVRLIEEVYGQS